MKGERDNRANSAPIRVLVVDDKPLAYTIERQWKAASEGEIHVKNASASDVATLKAATSSADVLIYPSSWLGELVEQKMLIPISSRVLDDADYDSSDILPLERSAAVTWGEKTFAVSFGVPQLVLMYRKDVFERHELTPPATWDDYQKVIDQLSSEIDASELRQVAVEPLAPGWASTMLLARAAAYARQRSRYWTLFDYATMEPMIDGPPFQRALEELVAAAREQKHTTIFTPREARRDLLAGRSLMALTWASANDDAVTDDSADIGFSPVPGSRQVYSLSSNDWETLDDRIVRVPLFGFDGRLGSVLTSSVSPHDAFNFLAWLTGKKRSATICSKSSHTAPFRQSHNSKVQLWVGDSTSSEQANEYSSVVNSMKRESLTMQAPRIPGRDQYMQALDQAVTETLHGIDAVAALNTAANRWREITEQLGVDKQRAAYKRSLGLEP